LYVGDKKEMSKYRLTFNIFKDEQQAIAFCNKENTTGNAYKRKNKKANYTPWSSCDKTETGFIVWYYV
jgi:hypothetical protein